MQETGCDVHCTVHQLERDDSVLMPEASVPERKDPTSVPVKISFEKNSQRKQDSLSVVYLCTVYDKTTNELRWRSGLIVS